MKTCIKNATLINEGKMVQASVLISGARIQSIVPGDSSMPADITIDATGQYLMPGIIDSHVHFRQPGMEHKADIKTESRAAAAGGITSFMEMPNTNPATTTMERLREKQRIASRDSLVNYAFYLGATTGNLRDIETLDTSQVAGVKVFMGSSTGNLLLNDKNQLERVFQASPILIVTHCEADSIIDANLNMFKQKYGDDIPVKYHPVIRSEEACYVSSSQAVELAEKYHANLHILHVTTKKEMDLFHAGPVEAKKITGEACIHHLWFSDADYDKYGMRIKWNPAIKTQADRNALRAGLISKKLDIVSTDHAPHLLKEKTAPYVNAASGGPMVQHSLQAMLELGNHGIISLPEIAEKMAHHPAQRFKIKDRGFIRQGYYADLVLVNPRQAYTVNNKNTLYKCGWSPFEDHTFSHSISKTLVNGKVVFDGTRIVEKQGAMPLYFDR